MIIFSFVLMAPKDFDRVLRIYCSGRPDEQFVLSGNYEISEDKGKMGDILIEQPQWNAQIFEGKILKMSVIVEYAKCSTVQPEDCLACGNPLSQKRDTEGQKYW